MTTTETTTTEQAERPDVECRYARSAAKRTAHRSHAAATRLVVIHEPPFMAKECRSVDVCVECRQAVGGVIKVDDGRPCGCGGDQPMGHWDPILPEYRYVRLTDGVIVEATEAIDRDLDDAEPALAAARIAGDAVENAVDVRTMLVRRDGVAGDCECNGDHLARGNRAAHALCGKRATVLEYTDADELGEWCEDCSLDRDIPGKLTPLTATYQQVNHALSLIDEVDSGRVRARLASMSPDRIKEEISALTSFN